MFSICRKSKADEYIIYTTLTFNKLYSANYVIKFQKLRAYKVSFSISVKRKGSVSNSCLQERLDLKLK